MKRTIMFMALVYSLSGCKFVTEAEKQDPPLPPSWNPVIQKFSNCSEVKTYLQSHRSPVQSIDAGSGADSGTVVADQVSGIQEGDILQMSPQFFFYARPGEIQIVQRSSLSTYKTIPTSETGWYKLIYTNGKLIWISGSYSGSSIKIFDEAKGFASVFEKSFVGSPVEVRRSGEKIYFVTESYVWSSLEDTNCSEIYRPNLEDGSWNLSHLHVVDFHEASVSSQTQSFLGKVDFIYMTENELFMFANGFNGGHMRIVDLKSTKPNFHQVQLIEGQIKDRWSITKKEDDLIVATTYNDRKYSTINNKLHIFSSDASGKKYKLAAESPSFGLREDIRAVRYLNDMAYIVTFEKTDPLFVLDLHDLKDIKIVSELKSPGFSTQLRELTNMQLGGLGYDAEEQSNFSLFQGLKFSLFDLRDFKNPQESEKIIWGDRGSYSEATAESKALYVSPEKDLIMFPVVTVSADTHSGYGNLLDFSGAVVLDFDGLKMTEVTRLTHQEWRESVCGEGQYFRMLWWNYENISMDIQRAVLVDGVPYSFSRFGIMKYDRNFAVTEKLAYKNKSPMMLCTLRR
ncbi:beta-propeller domain-containing protein [Bdellovibrio sp. HCB337]|uniref:beta-propeller domain-containing protein n=1 Tax=Bdellovibrio sp. HCB337 TaxID=3394358 RepID=UPI0039A727C3